MTKLSSGEHERGGKRKRNRARERKRERGGGEGGRERDREEREKGTCDEVALFLHSVTSQC